MKNQYAYRIALAILSFLMLSAELAQAARRYSRDSQGRVTIKPVQVDARFRNEAWPEQWERDFADRANYVIQQAANDGRYGTTYFESEKNSYAAAMFSVLGGYEEPALAFLQSPDNPGHWSKHTLGIDYYPAFTLKHQMRKYFFFGDLLEPDYRQRMKKAADIFTERDPLNRPHHAYERASGWGPNAKNSWVDVRNTDNLKLMRDTSVYLLAEEADNEKTRQLYKQHLTEFIVTLYHQGQGEWDSENYLGHSIAPLLNLYDFAQDPEVKLLAKSGLDFMAVAAAVKYYRGNFNGPTRRDYNHPYPFGGSTASLGWMWFGDAPLKPEEIEPDLIHVITSSYRPPRAVVELARKNFERPAELISGKPQWAAWEHPAADRPTFYETHYFGRWFQFGTLARGSQRPDINGFKLLTYSSQRGADTIIAGPVSDPTKLGSVMYNDKLIAPHSAVGQNGNMAIYLTEESKHPYLWLIPESAEVEEKNGVTFVHTEKASLAIWPINLSQPTVDSKLTEQVQWEGEAKQKKERKPRWPDSQVLSAQRRNAGCYGFAIEIDEGNRRKFVQRASQIQPETDEIPIRCAAAMTATNGRRVRLQWANSLDGIKIWRDGQLRDWNSPQEQAIWRTYDGDLISMPWQGDGELSIEAGGESFQISVTRDGNVAFSHD